jgi:hypothetical protein
LSDVPGPCPSTSADRLSGGPWLADLGSAGHILAYVAFVAVMVRFGAVIDAGRRVRTALRWSLIVANGVTAVVLTAMEVTERSAGRSAWSPTSSSW